MAALLFLKPFAQRLHQGVKPTKRLDRGAFLDAQMLFGQLFQPVARQIDRLQDLFGRDLFQPLKVMGKGAVKAVKVPLVLDHRCAGEIVERIHVIGGQAHGHALKKAEVFAKGYRDACRSKSFEKGQEHRLYPASMRSRKIVANRPTSMKQMPKPAAYCSISSFFPPRFFASPAPKRDPNTSPAKTIMRATPACFLPGLRPGFAPVRYP